MQQGVQTDAACNIQQCWELLVNNVASVCMGLKNKQLVLCKSFVLLKKHATNVFMMRILILEMEIAGEVGKRKIIGLTYCAVDM